MSMVRRSVAGSRPTAHRLLGLSISSTRPPYNLQAGVEDTQVVLVALQIDLSDVGQGI
jgi:hypothetical protein